MAEEKKKTKGGARQELEVYEESILKKHKEEYEKKERERRSSAAYKEIESKFQNISSDLQDALEGSEFASVVLATEAAKKVSDKKEAKGAPFFSFLRKKSEK